MVVLLLVGMSSAACTRDQLRQLIDRYGTPDKEKPEIYHEFEGYSPGAKKKKGKEDFSRYHYYIAPDKEEDPYPEPDIYFRQDYEAIEPAPLFDEEEFWREHKMIIDEPAPTPTENQQE